MSCLDDGAVLAFARGQLDDAVLSEATSHVDSCQACRLAVAAAAGAEPATDPERIGRFVIEGVAGRGAMGIVYRARDPRLERPVALKLIRPEALAPATRERFEREARALARVNHPNVVSIYEVGDEAGSIYIAMEYIGGGTLANWLAAEPRTSEQIVAVMARAGAGLAAAHRAGLVHRDFKPSNVLVDAGGRVCVTDFGLAHDGGELERGGAAEMDARSLLTQTGMVVGTPAYMAPEQHAAQPADPRSDQFAFCVTLFEAIAGHRPYVADDYAALVEVVRAGRATPPERGIPRSVHRAIRRGLAGSPSDRFATMQELLDALEAGPRSKRRMQRAALAISVVAAGAVVGVLAMRGGGTEKPSACVTAAERWRVALDAEAHEGSGDAGSISQKILQLGSNWSARYRSTCESREDSGVAEARRFCLDTALARADAIVDASLAGSDEVQTRRALLDAGAHIDRCASAELTQLAVPTDDIRQAVTRARKQLAQSAAHRYAHRYAKAVAAADAAIATSSNIGYAPVLAEAWLEKALAQRRSSASQASIDSSHRAVGYAQQSGHIWVLRSAAENLAWLYYFASRDNTQARHWIDTAEKLDAKAPPTEYERALRTIVGAHLLDASGKPDQAVAKLEALAATATGSGTLSADVGVRALEGALIIRYQVRRWSDASKILDRIAADFSKHRRARFIVAKHRGALLTMQNRAADAVDEFRRAVKLAADSSERADVLLKLGNSLAARGDVAGAEASWRDAVRADSRGPVLLRALCARAKLAMDTKRWNVAAETMAKCLAAREQRLEPNHPVLIYTLVTLGQIHAKRRKPGLAIDYLDRALTRFDAMGRNDDGVNAVRWSLAQMLDGSERARALELAESAASNLAATQPQLAKTIRRWVKKRKK